MREIRTEDIAAAVLRCIERSSFSLGAAERKALAEAAARETSETGKAVFADLLENIEIAEKERRPLCQDTGMAVVMLEIGQEVLLTGGNLGDAIQQAVAEGYEKFFLRKSILDHPLTRNNTGANTPAVIHTSIVPGDRVRLHFMAKGGGCENMSRLAMLMPSAGRDGVIQFVLTAIREAGGNPCPPVIVGVGIGGSFELCAMLAKKGLMRPLGVASKNLVDAELERELFEKINATNVGPMGLGGRVTALAVHVESHPCHIASLPVAVNLDCHSHRHAEEEL